VTSTDTTPGIGYILEPNGKASVFQRLQIYFFEGVMIRIEVVDHFGHQTAVLFHNPKANQVVELSEFDIVVPEGTDVIGDVTDRDPAG
jgi:outer membrane lipoprotein-sorting protein